jgi:hypothetical protein
MPFWSRHPSKVEERVEPLNEAEAEWLAANVDAARAALATTGIDPSGTLTAEALDRLWPRLLAASADDPNGPINVVGLAFGQLLVDRFHLEWVALTDRDGTEIALRGPSEFTVFPTNFVAKRYETGETEFLAPFVDEVARTLDEIGRHPSRR